MFCIYNTLQDHGNTTSLQNQLDRYRQKLSKSCWFFPHLNKDLKRESPKVAKRLFKSIQYSDQAFGRLAMLSEVLPLEWTNVGNESKTWISSKQNSGSCPNRNLIQLRHTCLSETQPPLSSAFDSIPWGSKILRYWSLIGGVVRVVQPIVIEIPCYPWNYMKRYETISSAAWIYTTKNMF